MTQFAGCMGHGFSKPESYCEAIQQLLDEHPPLREQMKQFYDTASEIAYDPEQEEVEQKMQVLHEQMTTFHNNIEPHSQKEEEHLFEMMVKHIGRQGGPIAVMEQEHDLAKENIAQFFNKYPKADLSNVNNIRELTHHVAVVFHTLTDHFMKEEEILFPMAETMMSAEEKEALLKKYDELELA
ncbi:hemerythrin domain-containing protein [Bacillus shivajii]|uniref:hemerythrin domain-containing protein n=1 Tax=Bacillus shivajii TaxID=1983719 RepID=UPI001CFC426C|nr:hemerythrin domain-containing protein [Bacillus shivajii]UCZ52004.1 hemerythrin domain-containing protein [Bacillus shivajii]